jgi:sterol desaturase/sphingolipid hydroxylase (fatty acid hydroxylase superfamily)
VTLTTNVFAGAGIVVALVLEASADFGLLRLVEPSPRVEVVIVLLTLDLSFYLAHVSLHKLPLFWRFHAVHHADPLVDATTTLRQHPGETLIRLVFTGAFACALGASPAAYATYRIAVALIALLEHANVRLPARIDRALSLVTTWPGFHKIHHARDAALTDSNYGNLFSWWDTLFGTRTPIEPDRLPRYGLDGTLDEDTQSLVGQLTLPTRAVFRGTRRSTRTAPVHSPRGVLE